MTAVSIDPDFLATLVCPVTRQPLRPASAGELERVNGRIRAGELRNRGGEPVAEPLDAGLVAGDGPVLYPVRDGIPILLRHEAVSLDGSAELDVPSDSGGAG